MHVAVTSPVGPAGGGGGGGGGATGFAVCNQESIVAAPGLLRYSLGSRNPRRGAGGGGGSGQKTHSVAWSSMACLLARSLSVCRTPSKKRPSALVVFLRRREGLLLGVAGAGTSAPQELLPRPSLLPSSLPFLLATILPPPHCSKVDCKGVGWTAKNDLSGKMS